MVKRFLPEHDSFYDAASLQLLYDNGVTAQLYADWHTPEGCWTRGDGRIVATGTKGVLEARLAGDSEKLQEPTLTIMTHEHGRRKLEMVELETTITEDFLNRIAGKPSIIGHHDIVSAMREAIAADESALHHLRARQ